MKKTELDDRALCLKMAETFDTHLLGELYDRFSDKVFGRCLSLTKDESASADLTHDIFLKVFAKCRSFKGDSSFSTWLHTITYNTAIDYLRKKKNLVFRDIEIDERVDEDNDTEAQLFAIRAPLIGKVLAELNAKDRSILMMYYLDGIAILQICEALQISESAVKMRLMRSRERALEIFQKLESKL